MKSDVIISVKGLHESLEDEDILEVISPGKYVFREKKHVLSFVEVMEGMTEKDKIRTTIRATESYVELVRKGGLNVTMIFELEKKHDCFYKTPFGDMLLGITTSRIEIEETENTLGIDIHYSLDVNYQHLADCKMRIEARNSEDFVLK